MKFELIYIPGEAFADNRIPTQADHKVVGVYSSIEDAMKAQKNRNWEGSPGMVFIKKVLD